MGKVHMVIGLVMDILRDTDTGLNISMKIGQRFIGFQIK